MGNSLESTTSVCLLALYTRSKRSLLSAGDILEEKTNTEQSFKNTISVSDKGYEMLSAMEKGKKESKMLIEL